MAVQFKQSDKKQLSEWIGGRHRYTLLYKISRDGCNSTTFHTKCDNKGPTVTLVYNPSGSVYGGYTSLNWRSAGAYYNDSNAFLFRLHQNNNRKPKKFPRKGNGNDGYDVTTYGPTFGGGHDLCTFTGTVNHNGTCYPLNGGCAIGSSYDAQGENINTICNGNLQALDLEVYSVEDLTNGPLVIPWRKTPEWNVKWLQELKSNIEHYKPLKELNVEQARILLVGQVGAGKSSFFNTINSIFRGYITSQACSGNAEHSLTTVFNPSVPISSEIHGFKSNTDLGDKIHCVAFVIDCSTVDVMPEKVLERIKSLQTRLNQKGIPQVVLLTKVDRVCSLTEENTSQVFFSPVIQDAVDKVSQIMGLPRSHILPLKNYEIEVELDDNVNILALLTLQQILRFADDYMYNYLDMLEEGKVKQTVKG